MRNYKLYLTGLPVIESLSDLSEETKISKGMLYKISKNNSKNYIKYQIEKRNGKMREIASPSREVKGIQKWILRNILDKCNSTQYATAYIREKNILENLIPHQGNRYVLILDIVDFFGAIKYNKIFNVFKTIGYSDHISHIFTNFCTLDSKLPQGGVTSPALSNLVTIKMDRRIGGFCKSLNTTYTRYADDMTFSYFDTSNFSRIKNFTRKVLTENEFMINEDKTRILGPRRRKIITGLTLSDSGIRIGKRKKKYLRSKIYQLYINKFDADIEKNDSKSLKTIEKHIDGWLSFLNCVDKKTYHQLNNFKKMQIKKANLNIQNK